MEYKNIFKALAQFRNEVGSVSKDAKNPFLKNKYATLDEMIKTCTPVLSKYGLSVIQIVSNDGVNTMLCHESGEYIETGCKLIETQVSKGLSIAQAEGVSITYTRRYQYGGLLGLAVDDDTDGQYGDNKGLEQSKKPVQPTKTAEEKFREMTLPEQNLYRLITKLKSQGDITQGRIDQIKKNWKECDHQDVYHELIKNDSSLKHN